MSVFRNVISVIILVLGVVYALLSIITLIKLRKNVCKKDKLNDIYSNVIIIAILYILSWLAKLR